MRGLKANIGRYRVKRKTKGTHLWMGSFLCSLSGIVEGDSSPPETKKDTRLGVFSFLVAGVGFEPHDLRVMSPTSYQAALPRDIMVPEAGVEPVRDDKSHGILSPGRLPIPPFRHMTD